MAVSGVDVKRTQNTAIERAAALLDGVAITVGFQGEAVSKVAGARVVRGAGRQRGQTGRTSSSSGRTRSGAQGSGGSWEPSSRSPRGAPRIVPNRSGLTIAQLAAIHEFGTRDGRVPERSFLRSMLRDHQGMIRAELRRIIRAAMKGESPVMALQRLAVRLEALAKKQITDLRSPPLAESTRRKRFAMTGDADPNPLIDTGQLRASITAVLHTGSGLAGASSGGSSPRGKSSQKGSGRTRSEAAKAGWAKRRAKGAG